MNRHSMKCLGMAALIAIGLGVLANNSALAQNLDPPTLSCAGSGQDYIDIEVCAGATGAAAGFSVQWKTCADFAANGWANECGASFSGVPRGSRYNLGPNQCVTVRIGKGFPTDTGASSSCGDETAPDYCCELDCDECYVFRAFAHNVPRGPGKSGFSANLECDTEPCEECCSSRSAGYWKTHDGSGPQPDEWCVTELDLGGTTYDKAALVAILESNNQLPRQLIAVKLSIACIGLCDPDDPVQDDVAAADAWIEANGINAPNEDLKDALEDWILDPVNHCVD